MTYTLNYGITVNFEAITSEYAEARRVLDLKYD
jgi:hypothetical protein